ncbi:MAG: FtsX-like permease family protein [Spirochaetaceae bacterium]|nr:FtsX-like permease family protein [Spirochaetaceae bacterium]
MIFLIALRNLIRNWKNSLVIFLLIAVIVCIFFVGNSVLGSSGRGLKASFTDNITGDIVLERSGEITMNLFGANTTSSVLEDFIGIPVLPAHGYIVEELEKRPEIAYITSQVSTTAILDIADMRSTVLLAGIDAETYFSLFPAITLHEGRFLAANEQGAMITEERAESIALEKGARPKIGDSMLFTATGQTGFRIREVPLVGIYSYSAQNDVLNQVVLCDVQTARAIAAIQIASEDVDLGADATSLLGEDIDSIFADEGEAEETTDTISDALNLDSLEDYLWGDDTTEENISDDFSGGDWNFILIKLKPGINAAVETQLLDALFKGYGVQAVGWRTAAGNQAVLALLLQTLFNGGVILVSIAGIIAVINILLIAVFKRTWELGTLRALGASGSFIRGMILIENCIIGIAAGIAGTIIGIIILVQVNKTGISISNNLLATLFGGHRLFISISPDLAFLSVLAAFILSALSSIYPIEKAARIQPIVALRKG